MGCNGVENYARRLAGREEGTPPECLIVTSRTTGC